MWYFSAFFSEFTKNFSKKHRLITSGGVSSCHMLFGSLIHSHITVVSRLRYLTITHRRAHRTVNCTKA
jgi:hypothetical protein